jgi:CxxC motif-containing protein (DUF1111 family)
MRLIRLASGKLVALGFCVAVGQTIGGGLVRADSNAKKSDPVAVGYEIFNREWMPNDPRAHGGDGLGPVYNDTSCVACHNSGGSGGAGPVSKNIDILNASRRLEPAIKAVHAAKRDSAKHESTGQPALIESPSDLHPAFRFSRTAVLHKFGTDPTYESWRNKVNNPIASRNFDDLQLSVMEAAEALTQVRRDAKLLTAKVAALNNDNDGRTGQKIREIRAAVFASGLIRQIPVPVGSFFISRSQRNPTALFGLGLIDAIPDEAIEAIAKREAKESPETTGRVSRLKDGRIGRLGWKGQTANTTDFVLNACAIELGLEVPGHHQAVVPQAPKYQASGLDLTSEECAALTAYVRSLPKPVERPASGAQESKALAAGGAMFASVGCAGCHAPKLGKIEGIYSDLLLHDMGADLESAGSYSDGFDDGSDDPVVPEPGPNVAGNRQNQPTTRRTLAGATRQEWRTPPLWGFRDSGPYLHDGRAQTLEQAVAMHGGQGTASARKFFELSLRERLQVESFLKSLVAPPAIELAQRAE